MKCRICGGELETKLGLGSICPSAFIKPEEKAEKFPLNLAECKKCGLVQLDEVYDLDKMYRQYWYRSSLNPSMVRSLQDVVDSIEKIVELEENSVVVDIGANDGTLLSLYKIRNLFKIAYEPALNLKEYLQPRCDVYNPDYFSAKNYVGVKAKVITSIAMFYDLPNPNEFVADISKEYG
jgi:NDP-4-keto-2,6-dideoxyhexose 3-C-methyltransferase